MNILGFKLPFFGKKKKRKDAALRIGLDPLDELLAEFFSIVDTRKLMRLFRNNELSSMALNQYEGAYVLYGYRVQECYQFHVQNGFDSDSPVIFSVKVEKSRKPEKRKVAIEVPDCAKVSLEGTTLTVELGDVQRAAFNVDSSTTLKVARKAVTKRFEEVFRLNAQWLNAE